jgi:hypothetical protein
MSVCVLSSQILSTHTHTHTQRLQIISIEVVARACCVCAGCVKRAQRRQGVHGHTRAQHSTPHALRGTRHRKSNAQVAHTIVQTAAVSCLVWGTTGNNKQQQGRRKRSRVLEGSIEATPLGSHGLLAAAATSEHSARLEPPGTNNTTVTRLSAGAWQKAGRRQLAGVVVAEAQTRPARRAPTRRPRWARPDGPPAGPKRGRLSPGQSSTHLAAALGPRRHCGSAARISAPCATSCGCDWRSGDD